MQIDFENLRRQRSQEEVEVTTESLSDDLKLQDASSSSQYRREISSLQSALEASKLELDHEKSKYTKFVEVAKAKETSLAAERETRDKSGKAFREKLESIIKNRNSKITELQIELDELKIQLNSKDVELRCQALLNSKDTKETLQNWSNSGGDASKADMLISSALSIAREEAAEASNKYLKAMEDLRKLRKEHSRCFELNKRLEINLKTEFEASRSAIDAMTEATLRRADLEGQYDIILSELLEMKTKCAYLGEDLDFERAKVANQKRRLIKYAERNAALEVQLTTRIF